MANDRQIRLFKRAFSPMPGDVMNAGAPPQQPAMPGISPQAMPGGPTMEGAPAAGPQGMPDPMAGGATPAPQGAPQQPMASTGDMVIDMLLSMGVTMVDGQTGAPIPPEAIAQLVSEMATQLGQGGVPGDQGVQPPVEGAPADSGMTAVMETLAQMDSNISALRDKIDSMRNIMEDKADTDKPKSEEADVNSIDAEVRQLLEEQAARGAVPGVPQGIPQGMPQAAPQIDPNSPEVQMQLLQAMQSGQI